MVLSWNRDLVRSESSFLFIDTRIGELSLSSSPLGNTMSLFEAFCEEGHQGESTLLSYQPEDSPTFGVFVLSIPIPLFVLLLINPFSENNCAADAAA